MPSLLCKTCHHLKVFFRLARASTLKADSGCRFPGKHFAFFAKMKRGMAIKAVRGGSRTVLHDIAGKVGILSSFPKRYALDVEYITETDGVRNLSPSSLNHHLYHEPPPTPALDPSQHWGSQCLWPPCCWLHYLVLI